MDLQRRSTYDEKITFREEDMQEMEFYHFNAIVVTVNIDLSLKECL